jgi:hypothetical protein
VSASVLHRNFLQVTIPLFDGVGMQMFHCKAAMEHAVCPTIRMSLGRILRPIDERTALSTPQSPAGDIE